MINIYEQITNNKRQSFLIIGLFIGFILLAAYAISYYFGVEGLLPIAFGYSLFSTGISYFWGDKIALSLNLAKPVTKKDYFDFYTVTENLSMAAQIPTPKIYVIESDAMNAFATGRNPENASICATTGLLQKLDRTELEGVVGHELSHIKNFDTRLMTMVSILIGTLSILTNIAYRSTFRSSDSNRKGGGLLMILGIVLIIFAPIIAQLIQLAISRRREFFADASAVMITRQPSGLISALQKLELDNTILQSASTATASMYINNPFKGNKLASMFSTHPPIADRISALKGMM